MRVSQSLALSDMRAYLAGCMTAALRPTAPLFAWRDGNVLTRPALLAVRALLDGLGIDRSPYRGISFRRGGATSLAEAGVPDRLIKMVGRWKSYVFARYIATDVSVLIVAAAVM